MVFGVKTVAEFRTASAANLTPVGSKVGESADRFLKSDRLEVSAAD